MGKDRFTTNEAAVELGVTAARVRQMVLHRVLPATKFGRDLVITAESLEVAKRRKIMPGPVPKRAGGDKHPRGQIRATNGTSTSKSSKKKGSKK